MLKSKNRPFPMFKKLVILGVLTYISTVILGASLQPGYSHLYNTVSELIVTQAPNKWWLEILFSLYNACLFIYGWLSHRQLIGQKFAQSVCKLIVLSGLIGIMLTVIPQSVRGAEVTISGASHIFLAGIFSITILIASAYLAQTCQKEIKRPKFAMIAWIIFSFITITSAITWIEFFLNFGYIGLFERLTVGGFLAWLVFFSHVTQKHITQIQQNQIYQVK